MSEARILREKSKITLQNVMHRAKMKRDNPKDFPGGEKYGLSDF